MAIKRERRLSSWEEIADENNHNFASDIAKDPDFKTKLSKFKSRYNVTDVNNMTPKQDEELYNFVCSYVLNWCDTNLFEDDEWVYDPESISEIIWDYEITPEYWNSLGSKTESYEDVSLTLIELKSEDNHITFRMDGYDYVETLDEILDDAIVETYDESEWDYAWDHYCKIIDYTADVDDGVLTTNERGDTMKVYVSDEILNWLDRNNVKYTIIENPKQIRFTYM